MIIAAPVRERGNIHGTWSEMVAKARSTWRTLKEEDFDVPYGDLESLAGRIQKKTGQTTDFVYRKLFEADAENGVNR